MIQSLHTAALGMKGQQTQIDTIANNIANVDTLGYKKSRANFKDALYVAMQDPSNAESEENLQKGTGTLVVSITKTFSPGIIQDTGRALDVALIDERSFFIVSDVNGELAYTRDGSFRLSEEDGEAYLVTGSGNYVLDDSGSRIALEGNVEKITIDKNGNIFNEEIGDGPFARLGLVTFQNLEGLKAIGNNYYVETEASGEATVVETADVKQRYIERSNVDLAEEMTNLIKAQRAYQISSRILQTADEMEEVANNLRR